MVSAENWVGLILAPLRTQISVMVPEVRADCTPESEGMHVTCGPPSRTRACTTAVLYCDTTADSRKLFLRRPLGVYLARRRRVPRRRGRPLSNAECIRPDPVRLRSDLPGARSGARRRPTS